MTRTSRIPRTRLAVLTVLAVVATALGIAAPASAAATHVGGPTWDDPLPLPIAVPGSFIGDNRGSTVAAGQPGSYWANTTWWQFTPGEDMNLTIRARSTDPEGWDNALEVRRGSDGSLVDENDDSYGLDAMLTVPLEQGVDYRIALGAYSNGHGLAELSFSYLPPEAPTDVAGVAGDGQVRLSWTAPYDNEAPLTRYTIYCTPDGGAETTCDTNSGTPPATGTTITGLDAGRSYTFRVSATNPNGESELSTRSAPIVPQGMSLSASPSPSGFTAPVTVTASVVPAPAPGTTTASFSAGGSPLSDPVPVVDGTAELVVDALPVGTTTVDVTTSGAVSLSRHIDVVVQRGDQTIEWDAPATIYVGARLTPATLLATPPAATTTSGLPPVLAAAAGACQIDGPDLVMSRIGDCEITLSQAGDANWLPAPPRQATIRVVAPPVIPPVTPAPPHRDPSPAPRLPVPPPVALEPTPEGHMHRIYLALFGRVADQGGLAYWKARSDGGTPMSAIVHRFVTSSEWRSLHGQPTGDGLVDVLYRVVLGREPDAGGRAHWAEQLRSGRLTDSQLVAAFTESSEMRERIREALALG